MEFVSHFDEGNFKSACDMIETTDFIGHNYALNYEIEIGDAASKLLGTQTKKLSVIHYALLNLDTHDLPEVNSQRRAILRAMITKVSLDLLQERSENGNTPVHVAAFLGETEILEMILERNASANIENKMGLRAVDMASNRETIDILKKYLPKMPRHKKGKSSSREPSLSPLKSSPKTIKLDSKASFADIKPEDDHHEVVTFEPKSKNEFVYVRKSSQEKMLEKGTVRNNPFLKRNSTISAPGFSKRFHDLQNEVDSELDGLIENAVTPKLEEIRQLVPVGIKEQTSSVEKKYGVPKGNSQMHIPRYQLDLNELESKHFSKAHVEERKSGIISKSRENSTIEIEESSKSLCNQVEEKVEIIQLSSQVQDQSAQMDKINSEKSFPNKIQVEPRPDYLAEPASISSIVELPVNHFTGLKVKSQNTLDRVELKNEPVAGVNSIISRFNNAPQDYVPKPFIPKYVNSNKDNTKSRNYDTSKSTTTVKNEAIPDSPLDVVGKFEVAKYPLITADVPISILNENKPDSSSQRDKPISVLNENTPDSRGVDDKPMSVVHENTPDRRSQPDKPISIAIGKIPDLRSKQDKKTSVIHENAPDPQLQVDNMLKVDVFLEHKLDLTFDDLPKSNLRDILNANPHELVNPIFTNSTEIPKEKVGEKIPILDKNGDEVFDISIVDFKKKSRGALRSVFTEAAFPKVEDYKRQMPKTDSHLSEETQNVINKLRSITDNSEAVPVTPKPDDLSLLIPQMGLSLEEDINLTISSLASFAKVKKDRPAAQYSEGRSSRLSSVAGRSEKSYSEISITDSQVSRTFSRQSFISYRSESQQSERITERYNNVSSKVFVSPGQMISSEPELIEGSTNSPRRNDNRVFIILVEEIQGLQPSMLPSIKGISQLI